MRFCHIPVVLICCALAWAGCTFSGQPYTVPDAVATARHCLERGNAARARQILEEYIGESPDSIAAWRVYQDALDGAGKDRFEELCGRLCPEKFLAYLASRRIEDLQSRFFELEKLSDGELSPWVYLDMAHCALERGDYSDCSRCLDLVFSLWSDCPEAHLLAAWLALRQVKWPEAAARARRAHEIDPDLIQPYFFEAAQQMVLGNYAGSIYTLKKVQLLFPDYRFSTDEKYGYLYAYWREILSMLRRELYQCAISTAREALSIFPGHSLFLTLQAQALWHTGQIDEAEKCLEQTLAKDPYRLEAVQLYRKVSMVRGEYRRAFDVWKPLMPEAILYHPENRVRDRYLELARAIAQAGARQPGTLIDLARALAKVGWEEEAQIVYSQIQDPGIENERLELDRHLRFMGRMRRLIYAAYETGELDVVRLLDRIEREARELDVPLDTRPSREFSSYFFVVRETDPFAPEPGSLGEYLARYNKCLDLGTNYGHIEARLMNRISLRNHHRKLVGRWRDYRVLIGDETFIDTFTGYHSGSPNVAGRAFLSGKGFYIAIDTMRPNLGHLTDVYRRLQHPAAVAMDREKLSYGEGIGDALLCRSMEPVMADLSDPEKRSSILYRELLLRKIDTVHNHELGHILDFPKFLPVYANLDEIVSMLAREGFSPQNIHTRFERMAELFGFAHTRYPYYYLYQEMERLDVGFGGIFTWVPWAWYGKWPDEDPYYLVAVEIFRDLARLSDGRGTLEPLMYLHQLSRLQLFLLADTLCKLADSPR